MNVKISTLKKIYTKNKYPFCIGAVLLCCLAALGILLLFMPKGYATGGDSNNPGELTPTGAGNECIVSAADPSNNYYVLDGSGKDFSNGVKIKITGATAGSTEKNDVYVILKNVNINLTSDVPGIKVELDTNQKDIIGKNYTDAAKFQEELLKCQYNATVHLLLDGSCSISNAQVADAKSPLIEAESFNILTESYAGFAGGKEEESNYIYYSSCVSLYIGSYSMETKGLAGSSDDSLTLTTNGGSYGAAIGARGGNPLADILENIGIGIKISDYDFSKPNYTPKEDYTNLDGSPKGYGHFAAGTYYLSNRIPSQYGAAPVCITSGRVEINGNGYGAGIGGGGHNAASDKTIEACYNAFGEKVNISGIEDTASVKIENGTVAVIMAENSKGSCFINGGTYGRDAAAADGLVTITGGSIYLKRQGLDTPYESARNENKDKLYAFGADYADKWTAYGDNIKDPGNEFDMLNLFDTENDEYKYNVEDIKKNGSDLEALSARVLIVGGMYNFKGYPHKTSEDNELLYFYLPATRLNDYMFNIEDNSAAIGGGIDYSVAQTYTKAEAEDSLKYAGYNFAEYVGNNTVKETKYLIIKIEGIPDYCEGITAKVKQNGSLSNVVVDSKNFVTVNGEQYLYLSNPVAGDVTLEITYKLGTYNVTYEYGLLPEDAGAAANGDINNTNSTELNCGMPYSFLDAVWAGHTFEGWYTDPSYAESSKLEQVPESVYKVKDGTLTVYAKWSCTVTYKIKDNMVSFKGVPAGQEKEYVYINKIPYNDGGQGTASQFDIMANAPAKLKDDFSFGGNNEALYDFIGYEYDGREYNDFSRVENISVTKDAVITAKFTRTGYFIYITAVFDGSNQDIRNYVQPGGLHIDYTDGGIGRTDIDFGSSTDADNFIVTTGMLDANSKADITIVPKEGYEITEKKVQSGSSSYTDKGSSSSLTLEYDAQKEDVYIYITFTLENFKITYYDAVNGTLLNGSPNPDKYNITDAINFEEPTNTDRDKYWRFLGFKKFGQSGGDYLKTIVPGTETGDLVLVAYWEQVPVYDIVIEDAGEYGSIEAYVEGEKADYAMEGEKVTIKATVNRGVMLNSISYGWTDAAGIERLNKKNYGVTDTIVSDLVFDMPATEVYISGSFEAIVYTLTYLNLNSAVNENPSTYTVFDSFDLASPQMDGWSFIKWQLITPNTDTLEDEFDVKTTDIARIENQIGNLTLFAIWENDGNGSGDIKQYHATVADNIINGQVELTKNLAVQNEYVFVKVSEDSGYRLKALQYSQAESSEVSPALARKRDIMPMSVDFSENQVAEGVYYFVMPDKDVEVTAVFEPIVYSIEYDAAGGIYDNVTEYTVEDEIHLKPAVMEGNKFLGWYDTDGNKVDIIAKSVGNITLTAKWENVPDNTDKNTEEPSGEEPTGNPPDDKDKDNKDDKNKDDDSQKPDISDRDNAYVNSGIQTGDVTNVKKLLLVSAVCALILIILIPKRREDDEEEEEAEI